MTGIRQKRADRARRAISRGVYLYDLAGLSILVNDVHLSSAVSLVISDVDGQLGGLQLLVAVRLAAAPNVNVLHRDKNDPVTLTLFTQDFCSCTGEIKACQLELTLPRSIMKQSPLLKLDQARSFWVALMALRPFTCSRRCTFASLVTTC